MQPQTVWLNAGGPHAGMHTIEGTTMRMNLSRAIAAAAAGAIVLGIAGLRPAAAADVSVPDYPQAPEAYQYGNPPPPPVYGYPPPPAYAYPPPVVYGYPAPPPLYYGPVVRRPYLGPIYGGYGYRRYAYGGPVFGPRGPYWPYRRHW